MSSDPAAKEPPRRIRIGKYEVLSHVATGGMGAVYKARDTEDGREVALKVLSPESAAKPGMVERFRREARHAAKLRHENIVTLYEFGEANRTYFLAMEFVEGIDLHEHCNRKGPLDPDEALDIIRQGCRALKHAHDQGVIHRDIKPSNFLLGRKGGRMLVKLTDLGLARESGGDEFRVTKAGTTVGTLDYMAPEQARDSGLADIRSDLYSLGSTWFHLLAGHAPFPKGGLGERLNRILNEDPPDIRDLNPAVSDDTAAVLHRLLEKKPARRYQTPTELLEDLDALATGRRPLAVADTAEAKPAKERPPRKGRRGAGSRSRTRADTDAGKSTAERRSARVEPNYGRLYAWATVAGILLVAGLVTFFLWRRHRADQPDGNDVTTGPSLIVPPIPLNRSSDPEPGEGPGGNTLVAVPRRPTWPALYAPLRPIDRAAMEREVMAPWAGADAPAPAVELVVGRLPPDGTGKTFRSLADACKAVPAGATGLIRLQDNGPFFDVPAAVADRNLVVRAAEGYRPLLVWDVQRTLAARRNRDRREPADEGPPTFLAVRHGNLTLEGVHVALKWPEAPSEGAAVLGVADGDLTVKGCTFSVVGRPRDGLTLARYTATAPAGPAEGASRRCRFTHCHARGAGLSVLDLQAPGAQVLFDDCLLVGGDAPLFQARATADTPTRLSVVRSTLVAGKNVLTVRPARPTDHDPALHWLGWDALVSRKRREVGGELLRVEEGAGTHKMKWGAINCLYAGWETLLAGPATVPAADVAGWRRMWDRIEGDVVQADPWPVVVAPEPAEVPAAAYRTANTPVAYASTAGPEHLLGCDPGALPPVRDGWLALTFDRFAVLAPPLPDDAGPPEIPAAADGLYHGERLDLGANPLDLGAYLQNVQKSYRLAPKVVLHLAGSGDRFTTPIRLKGSSLVLYFEPTPEKAEPLALVPAGEGGRQALVEIEGGNFDLIGGTLRISDAAEARVLPWLVKVTGGDVRLFKSRLEVSAKNRGSACRGLVLLEGSGQTSAEQVRCCLANETVLLSPAGGVEVKGVGARVLLSQTLLVAGDDALRLAPGPGFTGRANVQCVLDHATVSGRGCVVRLADVPPGGLPDEPVVVQTHDSAFLNLLPGRGSRPALLLYDGVALARGLLVWQSDDDAFDRRLWFGAAAAAGPLPDRPDSHASWLALWGTPALRHANLDLAVVRTLGPDQWSLERLAGLKIPGADLEKLGARPAKKPMR